MKVKLLFLLTSMNICRCCILEAKLFYFKTCLKLQQYTKQTKTSRSSHKKCSLKKCFKNFAKYKGKQLSQCLFFNKVAGLRSATEYLRGNAYEPQNFRVKSLTSFRNYFLLTHRLIHNRIISFGISYVN